MIKKFFPTKSRMVGQSLDALHMHGVRVFCTPLLSVNQWNY